MRLLTLRPGNLLITLCGDFVNGLQKIWLPASLPFKLQGFWLLPWQDCLLLNTPA